MNCLFCKIINNEISSKTIYEDDMVKVFLDINPTTNGDTLIIPKKHFSNLMDIDNETLNHIHEVIKKLYPIYQKSLHCDGLTICSNCDYGQEIKHFHVHFIPRYQDDNVKHLSNKSILKDLDLIQEELSKDFYD